MNKKITDDEIIKYYKTGERPPVIAEKTGLNKENLYKRWKELGLPLIRRHFTKEEDEQIINTYKNYTLDGFLIRLSQKLKRDRAVIYRRAKLLGAITRKGERREYSKKRRQLCRETMIKNRKLGKCITEGKGKFQLLEKDSKKLRKLFDKFLQSKMHLYVFARRNNYSDFRKLSKIFRTHFPDEYDTYLEGKLVKQDKLYKKGRRFEYEVKNYLGEKGYFVLRSPQSRSPIDLIAIKSGKIFLIQCKHFKQLKKSKRIAIIELAKTTNAIPLLALKNQYDRKIPMSFFQILDRNFLEIKISN